MALLLFQKQFPRAGRLHPAAEGQPQASSLSFLIIPPPQDSRLFLLQALKLPYLKSFWPLLALSLPGVEVGEGEEVFEGQFAFVCLTLVLLPLGGARMNQNQHLVWTGCFRLSFV